MSHPVHSTPCIFMFISTLRSCFEGSLESLNDFLALFSSILFIISNCSAGVIDLLGAITFGSLKRERESFFLIATLISCHKFCNYLWYKPLQRLLIPGKLEREDILETQGRGVTRERERGLLDKRWRGGLREAVIRRRLNLERPC